MTTPSSSWIRDLVSLAPALELRDPGIWFARIQSKVSYPASGNATCLQVEDRSFWFSHRNRCIVSVVRRFSPVAAFLDIGGGNGFVSRGLIDGGIACGLIEPGIEGALAAHARGIDPVLCARLEDSGLPPATISAAGMFDVLEHIEDEAAALRQVRTLLTSKGRLYLTVPAYSFLFSAADAAAGHYRRYTLSGLSSVLAAAGFRVEFASYIFAPLPPIIFVLRTVPSALGLRRGVDLERDSAELAPRGLSARFLACLLAAEYRRVEAGRTIPSGGSCLCVAVKD